jgi:hypothetical protein
MKKLGSIGCARPRTGRGRLQGSFAAFAALAATVTATVTGCYPKAGSAPAALSAATITSASARWPGTTASSLAAGRDLFLVKCNGCHDYPDLAAIADERWPHIVEKMGTKSHLNPAERDEVLRYVLAWRSEQAAAH